MVQIKKISANFVSMMFIFAVLIAFFTGCGDSSVSADNSADQAKPVENIQKSVPTAQELMDKLIGKWKNETGDYLVVTKDSITYYNSSGTPGVGNEEYKLKGIENALPNAIRLELGRLGMLGEAVAAFNGDNSLTFGILGDMPVKLTRE